VISITSDTADVVASHRLPRGHTPLVNYSDSNESNRAEASSTSSNRIAVAHPNRVDDHDGISFATARSRFSSPDASNIKQEDVSQVGRSLFEDDISGDESTTSGSEISIHFGSSSNIKQEDVSQFGRSLFEDGKGDESTTGGSQSSLHFGSPPPLPQVRSH
jgi:hypothetical protein